MEVGAVSAADSSHMWLNQAAAVFACRFMLQLAKVHYIVGLLLLIRYGCLLIPIEQDAHKLWSPIVACNNNNNNNLS